MSPNVERPPGGITEYRDYVRDKVEPHKHWQTPDHLETTADMLLSLDLPHDGTASLLDVGCGIGQLYDKVGPLFRYTGLDTSEDFITEATARYAADEGLPRFMKGLAEKLPFAKDAFDVVVCSDVLMHVPDARVVLLEVARAARRFVVLRFRTGDPTWQAHKRYALCERTNRLYKRMRGQWHPFNVFTFPEVQRWMAIGAGFRVLATYQANCYEDRVMGKTVICFLKRPLMLLTDLWDAHKGKDIYLVGTGPSMRVFPLSQFQGRVTLGLNQAWRYAPLTYCITAHPELVTEYLDYHKTPEGISAPRPTAWIVKKKAPLHVDDNHPLFYAYDVHYPAEQDRDHYVRHRVPGKLTSGGGIHTSAMNLAAHMGARAIILVGVDLGALGDDHHGHAQHVQLRGFDKEFYRLKYYHAAVRVRQVIQRELKIPVLTLTPFVGLRYAEDDYRHLCERRGLSALPVPVEKARKVADPFRHIRRHLPTTGGPQVG